MPSARELVAELAGGEILARGVDGLERRDVEDVLAQDVTDAVIVVAEQDELLGRRIEDLLQQVQPRMLRRLPPLRRQHIPRFERRFRHTASPCV